MKITDNGACRCIASKIREFRGGNRLMARNDLNMNVTFYRRDQPETKVGTVQVNGGCDFSLADAGIVCALTLLALHLFGAIASVLRRL